MSNKYYLFIKSLRTERGFSQVEIAEKLGISRSSYIAFEQGKRELALAEANVLSKIFQISIEDIQRGKIAEPVIVFEKEKSVKKSIKRDSKDPTPEERISVPQKNIEKFKQVLLYVLEKVGAKPNVGMTVLYKLLYFIDFDYYEKYEEQLMGLTYFKNTHGPAPREFKKVVDEMKEANEVAEVQSRFFAHDQKKFLPRIQPDLSILSGRELEMIDDVLGRYADKTATQLSDMTHRDIPWRATSDGKDIDYEFAFYRRDEFSVREYEEL